MSVPLDPRATARRHNIRGRGPAPRFMDGALLGNGAVGVVLTTRPDAVVMHFGHNDVWDERIDESHRATVRTFAEVFERAREVAASGRPFDEDPWFSRYIEDMQSPYEKPYPRPHPCGSVVLGIDRRHTSILGHELDISTGEATVHIRHRGESRFVTVFVASEADDVHLWTHDEFSQPADSPFVRVRVLPDLSGPAGADGRSSAELAIAYTIAGEPALRDGVRVLRGDRTIGFEEALPSSRGQGESDRHRLQLTFGTLGHLADSVPFPSWYGGMTTPTTLEAGLSSEPLIATIRMRHPRGPADAESSPAEHISVEALERARAAHDAQWAEYWSKSAVTLSNPVLERAWYRGTYFLRCCVAPAGTAPGLFGNWSLGEVGTAWHGDYHMNYNTQQVYWGVFSSNRVELHEPYVRLVESLLPLARSWARDYYDAPGAVFPHSAYPVEMSLFPFPSPVWGWEMCETPWTVQSLWWHYLYTGDEQILARVFEPLRDATEFMLTYMNRYGGHAPGAAQGELHIFPSVVPEIYGLAPGLAYNADCLVDVALTKFLFRAYLEAARLLPDSDNGLAAAVSSALERFPEYFTSPTDDGDVYVSVEREHPDVVYNVPIPGMAIFPGEDPDVYAVPERLEVAKRSVSRQRLEGGNELVFAALQRARLGILDVDAFADQLTYCELPNGTLTDMLLETRGRYNDYTPFDFMAEMGVFVENFAIPAVVNELLLRSYDGVIRVFPHRWDDARFSDLRAVGAFTVSASMRAGRCAWIRVRSERGNELRVEIPWSGGASLRRTSGESGLPTGIVTIPTVPGELLWLVPRSDPDHALEALAHGNDR